MDAKALKFLTEVLGTEGAKALARTTVREPALAKLLVPRAALSWLSQRESYEGVVPGIPNSYLRFQKSEDVYSGIVTLTDTNYEFSKATNEHVAAAVAVAVGVDLAQNSAVRDLTLVRLGKSIDALVKAQQVAKDLPKSLAEEDLDKGVEAPGPAAGPVQPKEPEDSSTPAAQGVGGRQLVGQKPKRITSLRVKVPALKVEKSEMDRECKVCGGHQFSGGTFKGCLCFRDLKKHVHTNVYSDGVVLEFDSGFTTSAYTALRKNLKET
jgi:hypothetical protein